MNPLNITLTIVGVAVIVFGVVDALYRKNKELKKTIADLNHDLAVARVNVKQMAIFIDKMTAIKSERTEIEQRLKDAKNDEEVYEIISDIVSANNSRVQDNKG